MSTIAVVFDPPAPSDSPSVFNSKAFSTLGDLNTWSAQANTVAAEVNSNKTAAAASATSASDAASIATTQASAALASATSASASESSATGSKNAAAASASAAAISATNAAASASAAESTLANKLNATDASVTNAREWTASTVTQAEAEAGAATTRRAWTAQLVRQAIAGWWAGISTLKNGMVFEKASGAEGGALRLQKADTSALASDTAVDMLSGTLRIFEAGGTARGAYLDLSQCAAAVGSTLWHSNNDGAGSGLDADLLDGKHASDFAEVVRAGAETDLALGDTTNPGYFYGNTNEQGAFSANGTQLALSKLPGANSYARLSAGNVSSLTGGATAFYVRSSGLVEAAYATGLGYGAGSGGVVTQVISKSTGVTLNKPSGQITMHNAALAAGATVQFTLADSCVAAADAVIVNICDAPIGNAASKYAVAANAINNGSCVIRVTNISAGSLSEALVINFAVLKGSVA